MKKILFLSTLLMLWARLSSATIYHLIGQQDLKLRTVKGFIFEPSLQTEGFTHGATLSQVVAAANRHYKDIERTLLLKIDERKLIYPLRYDYVERHKQYFPHVYGPINMSAVQQVFLMQRNSDGTFRLPEMR